MLYSPRERELLAHLLRVTSYDRLGEGMADRLLERFGSLRNVLIASFNSLMKCGLTEAQATMIAAMYPIARRYALEQLDPKMDLLDPDALNAYVRALYVGVFNERFMLISLDKRGRFIEMRTVAEGTSSQIPIQIRTLLECALQTDAASVFFVHNHPDGERAFSQTDILSTRFFANLLKRIGVAFVDHLLYVDGKVVSMRETCGMPGVFTQPEAKRR